MAKRPDQPITRLATLSPAELRAEWEQAYGTPAPALPASLLRHGIAYRWQEKQHGALPAAVARALARVANGKDATPNLPVALRPGTQLFREWQGRMITVTVEEGGFLFDGRRFGSLSGIAKEVTGAHWSGPRFFGLARHA